ncbi:hypothetical protein DCC62_00930 [candidate division KSB1 bacterium]|nr:MAG: hypothetical protein DCC62_00930 [candidate division KSB1 bacterium]
MADNPIPEELKSDHLFLLIGGNPLPNWVAARVLLREDGQVYLVHSKETNEVARRLAGVLIKQQYRPPIYVPVLDASSPHEVYRALEQQVKTIKSGQIGFNYTGGTKVMSVHGYFAIKDGRAQGPPAPIFSYLDALSLKMYFDDGREPIFVGLAPRASLTLKELLSFHEVVGMQNPKREPVAPSVVEALKELHGNEDRYLKWRKWIMELQNPSKKDLEKPKPKAEDRTLEDLEKEFPTIANALLQNGPAEITWKQLCQQRRDVWPFKSAGELINWLEGEWMESYVLAMLQKIATRYPRLLNNSGMDFKIELKSSKGKFDFQVDVAAMRGYQLHFISCYSGHHKQNSKYKLFEAFTRAKQIGGDEAGAALISMSEDPKSIEYDAAQVLQAEGRIKVYGRRELQDLERHLTDWFQTEIPSEYL